MSAPTVSVLTTVHNREKYLAECIKSVLDSSFTDFEYIIVDDCSTDRSHEIALEFAAHDSRISVYRNSKNLGDYPNRSQAASYAKGKYLKFVDSDDVIYPHGLGVMVGSIGAFPQSGLALSRNSDPKFPFPFLISKEESYREHFLQGGLFTNAPLSVIIKAEAFRSVGGFSGKRYVGDTEMWLKIAAHYPIVKMAAGLTWWRNHGEQEFAEGHSSFRYLAMNYSISEAALLADECPLNAFERSKALAREKRGHIRALLRFGIAKRKPKRAAEIWRQSGLSVLDLRVLLNIPD